MVGTYTQAVQKLYVAYFSRPADAAGLVYWEGVVANQGGNTAAVSAAFAASKEYKDTYAGKGTAEIINTIYQNLFGRDAEPAGRDYWAQLLTSGAITIDNAVATFAAGAQNADAIAYRNKVTAATEFTAALDTTLEMIGYVGDGPNLAAKVWLRGVTTDASLALAITKAALDEAINKVISGGGDPNPGPKAVVLTVNQDVLTGTAGDDLYTGVLRDEDSTLSLGDAIDGGDGTDTLKVTTDQDGLDLAGLVFTNLEHFVLDSSAASAQSGSTFNLGGNEFERATFKGIKGVDGSLSSVTISGLNATTTVVLQDIKDVGVTITYDHVNGTNDSATVEFAGSTDTPDKRDDENRISIAGIEDLTLKFTTAANDVDRVIAQQAKGVGIEVSGGAARMEGGSDFRAATQLNINAEKDFTIAGSLNLANKAVITVVGSGNVDLGELEGGTAGNGISVNASELTGNLTVVGNNNTASIAGGSGNDHIVLGTNLTVVDAGDGDDYVSLLASDYGLAGAKTVNGGAGRDYVNIIDGSLLDSGLIKKVIGFEGLALAGASGTFNLYQKGFEDVLVDGDFTAAVTVSGITDETITIAETTSATLELELRNGGEDAEVNVHIAGPRGGASTLDPDDDQYDVAVAELLVANVGTLNINSSTDEHNVAGVANTINLLSTSAAKLVITGDHVLRIGAFASETGFGVNTETLEIDASESAGLVMDDVLGGDNVEIAGSAHRDVIRLDKNGSTVNAGKGGDAIFLSRSTAGDVLILQAGDSKVGYIDTDGSGSFSLTADELKYDVITNFASGTDTLDLGEFSFTGTRASGLAAPTMSASAALNFVKGSTSSITNFFVSSNVKRAVAVVSGDFSDIGGKGTDTLVFIDTNNDGNLSAADEMVVLAGTASIVLGDIGF